MWQVPCTQPHTCDHLVSCQVILSEPVLITGITILPAEGESERRQVFKAWARDLNTPTSARFTALFGPVTGPCEGAPVGQVGVQLGFTTDTDSTVPCAASADLTWPSL